MSTNVNEFPQNGRKWLGTPIMLTGKYSVNLDTYCYPDLLHSLTHEMSFAVMILPRNTTIQPANDNTIHLPTKPHELPNLTRCDEKVSELAAGWHL
jgi:hypothetical protein